MFYTLLGLYDTFPGVYVIQSYIKNKSRKIIGACLGIDITG